MTESEASDDHRCLPLPPPQVLGALQNLSMSASARAQLAALGAVETLAATVGEAVPLAVKERAVFTLYHLCVDTPEVPPAPESWQSAGCMGGSRAQSLSHWPFPPEGGCLVFQSDRLGLGPDPLLGGGRQNPLK